MGCHSSRPIDGHASSLPVQESQAEHGPQATGQQAEEAHVNNLSDCQKNNDPPPFELTNTSTGLARTLLERAVHPLFLKALAEAVYVPREPRPCVDEAGNPLCHVYIPSETMFMGKPPDGMAGNEEQWVVLGELTTTQVVERFIKPLTAAAGVSAAQAWEGTALGPQLLLEVERMAEAVEWCQQLRGPVEEGAYFGKATYFVSHAWKYKFGDLAAIVEQEWLQGRTGYFWVDILAVGQHFKGDFNKNPDSDFGSIIAGSSGGLLLTIHPSSLPITPTRIWCLFEIGTAYLKSAPIAVSLTPGNDEQVLAMATGQAELATVDVSTAQAAVESDRQLILAMIREAFHSYTECNSLLRRLIAAAARNTALLTCLSELRVCGSTTNYGRSSSWFWPHLRAWDAQDGGRAAAAAGEEVEKAHDSDGDGRATSDAKQARQARLQVLDRVHGLLKAGAYLGTETLSGAWLTAAQTIEGVEAMAAAIRAPGSRVRHVEISRTMYASGGSVCVLGFGLGRRCKAYLEMLLSAPSVSAAVVPEGQGDEARSASGRAAVTVSVENDRQGAC